MNGEKKPNNILRRERLLRGWSQQKVASLVETSEDVVSRWERGERKPSPFYQEKFCVLYGKTAEELGFLEPYPNQSPAILTLVTDINQAVNERLEQAESILNLAWEAWFGSRPKQVTREITKLLPSLERMFNMPLAPVHVLHIKELVIRCHGLLGTIYLDALQNDAAFYHYVQAHKFAEDIHDPNLTATYLALMGDVLRQQNDKATALSYMENARDRASHGDRATLGHILQLLAYTYGDIGNETAFERAIAEATDLLAFAGEGRDTVRKEFIPFEVYEIRGKINRDLGKPLAALPYLELAEKSLDKAESVTPRWHALLEISRGQAFCDASDITTGLDLVSKGFILAYQCHSPHQMNRVRKLLRKLGNSPSRNHPKVQNLKDLLYETYMRMDNDAL
jgi:transcriptional regulator with XRE-family HTH domain